MLSVGPRGASPYDTEVGARLVDAIDAPGGWSGLLVSAVFGIVRTGRQGRRVTVNIGEQRRTIYIEPIEEPEAWPIEEPSPALDPAPPEPQPAGRPDPAG